MTGGNMRTAQAIQEISSICISYAVGMALACRDTRERLVRRRRIVHTSL